MSSLRRRFFRLAWLNILSNVTVPLVGLVDTAMLGHLEEIRFLAGVALGSILFDFVYWTFGFLRMGTTGLTAQAMGSGDADEAYSVLHRSLTLALLVAAAVLLLWAPLRELGFRLLSGTAAVEAAGREYFDARILGAPATLCNFALLGWFLGREQSGRALVMTVVANVANIVLNYVFIIRLGWAAYGAGFATMLSQYLMLAVATWMVLRQPDRAPWRTAAVFDRTRLRRLLGLNTDILVRTLCLITSFAVFTNFSSILGTAVLAANTILLRLVTLAAYLIDGAAFAAESVAGVLRGRGETGELRRLFRLSLIAGEAFAAAVLAVVVLWRTPVLALLTSHGDIVDLALRYLPWLVPVLLLGAPAYMYDGLFLGLTEGRALRRTMMFSTLVVFLPLALWARAAHSNDLLWGALTAFMLARTATLALASRRLLPA